MYKKNLAPPERPEIKDQDEGVPFFLDSNPVKLKESVSPLCIKALRNS